MIKYVARGEFITKECSICKEIKIEDEFYSQTKLSKKRGTYVYYHPECKMCTIRNSTKWQKDNRERYRELSNKNTRKPERKEKVRKYIQNYKDSSNVTFSTSTWYFESLDKHVT